VKQIASSTQAQDGFTLSRKGFQESASLLASSKCPSSESLPTHLKYSQGTTHQNRAGGKDDSAAVFGYAAAETLAQVLKQCGNDLSRENVMKQAATLKDYQGSVLLPGIKISTGPWNFRPIKSLRLVQFDGRTWQPIGEVLETAFSNTQK
jgi:ABC-type branched-subunit amino acid transport system substrate-binding protein